MDIVEIQHTLGNIISGLSLIRNDISTVCADGMNQLLCFLTDNQLEYEKAIRNEIKDKGSDYFVGQLFLTLASYLEWYSMQNDDATPNTLAKQIYDRIAFLWIPPIERIFPSVISPVELSNATIPDVKDPEGYNKLFEQAGEHYRSIRYDIIENRDYPHLTNDEIYRRLKEMVSPVAAEGVKIAMILNIAIKNGLLKKKPQGKSLERELGMKCSLAAVNDVIATPGENFYLDDWGKAMEVKLLK